MEAPLTIVQRARQDLPNFVSLLAFFLATALFFRSWEFALITTASLGFHELGHAAALSWLGLKWRIAFGVVGAWTWSNAEERARLPQLANVFVHMSGPFFSLLLAGVALTLNVLAFPNDRHLLILANFSAQVGFLNLLPLGSVTDGGKIVRRMVTSVNGKHRTRAILLPVIVVLLMLLLYTWAQLPKVVSDTSTHFMVGLLLIGIWTASSLLLESHAVDRLSSGKHAQEPILHALNPSIPVTGGEGAISTAALPGEDNPLVLAAPMTVRQVSLITLLLWDMLAVYLIIMTRTPFWLEPIYVEGGLKNVVDVLHWLAKLI